MFAAEITVLCESIKPGCEFRAVLFDRASYQFYGGSGATAFDAVAWALDEYMCRTAGLPVMPARGSKSYPGERLGGAHVLLSGLEVRDVARPTTDTRIDTIGSQYVKTPPTGCFDAQIPRSEPPAKASSAARRSAAKKKGAK